MDHAARRARLVERLSVLDVDALLVMTLVDVRYLTGFTGSNAQLLVGGEAGVLFTDGRYEEQSRHEVPDLDRRIYPRDFARLVEEVCRATRVTRLGFEASGVTYRAWGELGSIGVELVPLDDEVARLRWGKDTDEVALIERAQQVTDRAFERVVPKLAEGVSEREVAVELEIAMREGGAERVGFDTIVAFGESAAEPHHRPTERPLARGDVVKMDFGCVVDGYHSDMTRTVSFGEPAEELRSVYEIVRSAQEAGIDAVRAGVTGAAVDRAARGLIAAAGYGDRFGHSLGHGVGLEIHEGPTLRSSSEDVLPERAVVTVEPGIYLPGVGGVRIEDMVVVEPDGCRPLPRTPKDLMVL